MTAKVKPSAMSIATVRAFRDAIQSETYNTNVNRIDAAGVPTVTVSATAGLPNGDYSYYVTFYTATGETARGGGSVVKTANLKQINLTGIPVSPNPLVIGRRIYRNNMVDDIVSKQLVVDIADNVTTSYTDNKSDAQLGVYVPHIDTTGGETLVNDERMAVASGYGTVFGLGAMALNTGYANAAFGAVALAKNTTGLRNVAIGMFALYENLSGYVNSSLGVHSLNNNVSGLANCAFGYTSLQNNLASYNCAFGVSSLNQNLGGQYNCAFGYISQSQNQTGNYNSSFGNDSLRFNILGDNNTAFGALSLQTAIGSGNIGIGYNAGRYEQGNYKLFVDSVSRASESDGRLKSLIYGEMDALTANQLLAFNATKIKMNYLPTSASGLEIGQLWNDSGTIKIVLT